MQRSSLCLLWQGDALLFFLLACKVQGCYETYSCYILPICDQRIGTLYKLLSDILTYKKNIFVSSYMLFLLFISKYMKKHGLLRISEAVLLAIMFL